MKGVNYYAHTEASAELVFVISTNSHNIITPSTEPSTVNTYNMNVVDKVDELVYSTHFHS